MLEVQKVMEVDTLVQEEQRQEDEARDKVQEAFGNSLGVLQQNTFHLGAPGATSVPNRLCQCPSQQGPGELQEACG